MRRRSHLEKPKMRFQVQEDQRPWCPLGSALCGLSMGGENFPGELYYILKLKLWASCLFKARLYICDSSTTDTAHVLSRHEHVVLTLSECILFAYFSLASLSFLNMPEVFLVQELKWDFQVTLNHPIHIILVYHSALLIFQNTYNHQKSFHPIVPFLPTLLLIKM